MIPVFVALDPPRQKQVVATQFCSGETGSQRAKCLSKATEIAAAKLGFEHRCVHLKVSTLLAPWSLCAPCPRCLPYARGGQKLLVTMRSGHLGCCSRMTAEGGQAVPEALWPLQLLPCQRQPAHFTDADAEARSNSLRAPQHPFALTRLPSSASLSFPFLRTLSFPSL